MLGGAVGDIERLFFPHLTGSTGTYVLVGMGVLFAGFLRVPMTSVFMVLEVSGNYEIIVPVIVANTVSYLVSRSLQTVPIFDLLTRQDGLILPSLEEDREEAILRVEDAMLPVPPIILNAEDYVDANARRIHDSSDPAFLVIAREHLQRVFQEGKGEHTLASILPKQSVPSLYPDLPLDAALRYVNNYSLVPVVNRANSTKLEGVISRDSVFQKYGTRSHHP
jgi:CIC family chloride channel protein